jgi:PAS domain-containing protein
LITTPGHSVSILTAFRVKTTACPTAFPFASVPGPHKLGHWSSSEGDNVEQDCYRILADATYDWESWLTGDGLVRWVNPAVQRFTGWTVADCPAVTDYPLPLVHTEDRGIPARTATEHPGHLDAKVRRTGAAGQCCEIGMVSR